MPVKPIAPTDLAEQMQKTVPDGVIEAWNEAIAENFSGGSAHFTQNDLVSRICEKMMCDRSKVFDHGWLNLEPIFEKAGWKVEYDKPMAYAGEDGEPSFTFTRRK